MKKYRRMYHVSGEDVSPVLVRPVTQQGRTVWRGELDMFTYPGHSIRKWSGLTANQKIAAYYSVCEDKIDGARWSAAKDPTLSENANAWIAEAIAERDAAIRSIRNGENVPPPKE